MTLNPDFKGMPLFDVEYLEWDPDVSHRRTQNSSHLWWVDEMVVDD